MVTHLDAYFKSDEYKRKCKAAFQVANIESVHIRICTQMNFSLLGHIIRDKKYDLEKRNNITVNYELSQVEVNVLRFVSGACIHHVNSKLKSSVESKMFSSKIYEAKINYRCHKFVNFLRVPEAFITAQFRS